MGVFNEFRGTKQVLNCAVQDQKQIVSETEDGDYVVRAATQKINMDLGLGGMGVGSSPSKFEEDLGLGDIMQHLSPEVRKAFSKLNLMEGRLSTLSLPLLKYQYLKT